MYYFALVSTMCSCQRTQETSWQLWPLRTFFEIFQLLHSGFAVVGVTGFEPVTLRLSSACSNQLSYTPVKLRWCASTSASAGGAEESRTPDTLLAKQVLYH